MARDVYPPGTAKSRELFYASRQVTSIEINSTFYRLQKPSTFAKWRDSTPDDFMFSIKAPRFILQRRNLSSGEAAVERFMASGLHELGCKLGPILWQLPPTKPFDASELNAFLDLLPATAGRRPLRHAMEARHPSYATHEYLDLLRRHGVASVYADDAAHARFSDLTSTFVYTRLRRSTASAVTGYSPQALAQWVRRARLWARGEEPADLPRVAPRPRDSVAQRDVFIYFISGAKERNPAAARKLLSMFA
jgi:uncharacterized protein YecE (DUF72 family)